MRSFRTRISSRRAAFLSLATQIESQLREAYDAKHSAGEATQSSLAAKLGVNRSAIHHRLSGRTNMTIETIADMVWALNHAIRVIIYDPAREVGRNQLTPISGGIEDHDEAASPAPSVKLSIPDLTELV